MATKQEKNEHPATYLITVVGTMEQGGERESIELMTYGHYARRGRAFYLLYDETEATGYKGCQTALKATEDGREVVMTRYGEKASQLVIEKGVRHLCHYETDYGAITLGVAADAIELGLDDDGGRLQFSYILDNGGDGFISRNLVDITIQKVPDTPPEEE